MQQHQRIAGPTLIGREVLIAQRCCRATGIATAVRHIEANFRAPSMARMLGTGRQQQRRANNRQYNSHPHDPSKAIAAPCHPRHSAKASGIEFSITESGAERCGAGGKVFTG
jgi:hypothetical protein